jgi:hypothetical protein
LVYLRSSLQQDSVNLFLVEWQIAWEFHAPVSAPSSGLRKRASSVYYLTTANSSHVVPILAKCNPPPVLRPAWSPWKSFAPVRSKTRGVLSFGLEDGNETDVWNFHAIWPCYAGAENNRISWAPWDVDPIYLRW